MWKTKRSYKLAIKTYLHGFYWRGHDLYIKLSGLTQLQLVCLPTLALVTACYRQGGKSMRVRKARVVMHLNHSCIPIWSKNPDYKWFDCINTLLLMTFTAKAGVQIYINATACYKAAIN